MQNARQFISATYSYRDSAHRSIRNRISSRHRRLVVAYSRRSGSGPRAPTASIIAKAARCIVTGQRIKLTYSMFREYGVVYW